LEYEFWGEVEGTFQNEGSDFAASWDKPHLEDTLGKKKSQNVSSIHKELTEQGLYCFMGQM
jgi:hypothetical protein